MDAMTRTLTAPAQNLKGVALEPDPDCFGPFPLRFDYDAPADRRIVSVCVENGRRTPVEVKATAAGIDGYDFTAPPRTSARYDVPPAIVATQVRFPGFVGWGDEVFFSVHLAPL